MVNGRSVSSSRMRLRAESNSTRSADVRPKSSMWLDIKRELVGFAKDAAKSERYPSLGSGGSGLPWAYAAVPFAVGATQLVWRSFVSKSRKRC